MLTTGVILTSIGAIGIGVTLYAKNRADEATRMMVGGASICVLVAGLILVGLGAI